MHPVHIKKIIFTVKLNSFISSTSGANALKLRMMNLKNTENELLNSMVDENMALNNLTVEKMKILKIQLLAKRNST